MNYAWRLLWSRRRVLNCKHFMLIIWVPCFNVFRAHAMQIGRYQFSICWIHSSILTHDNWKVKLSPALDILIMPLMIILNMRGNNNITVLIKHDADELLFLHSSNDLKTDKASTIAAMTIISKNWGNNNIVLWWKGVLVQLVLENSCNNLNNKFGR